MKVFACTFAVLHNNAWLDIEWILTMCFWIHFSCKTTLAVSYLLCELCCNGKLVWDLLCHPVYWIIFHVFFLGMLAFPWFKVMMLLCAFWKEIQIFFPFFLIIFLSKIMSNDQFLFAAFAPSVSFFFSAFFSFFHLLLPEIKNLLLMFIFLYYCWLCGFLCSSSFSFSFFFFWGEGLGGCWWVKDFFF